MKKISILNSMELYMKNGVLAKYNYKKIVFVCFFITILSLSVSIMVSSHKYSKHIYNTGVYTGIAAGYHSDIKVEVVTDKYRILQIDITDHHEMPVISEVVFKDIPYRVIRENNTDVDIVSGATYTSNGLIKALDNALSKARLPDLEDKK